jgi:hypothetical protein
MLGSVTVNGSTSTARACIQFPETGGASSIDPRGRRLDGDTGQTLLGPGVLAGTRYCIAAVFNYGAATLTSYTNGVQLATVGSFQTAGNTSATASGSISVMWDGGSGGFFQGPFEAFLVWPRILSPAEVTQAYPYLNPR